MSYMKLCLDSWSYPVLVTYLIERKEFFREVYE